MTVWILESHGDGDYHGGDTVVDVFATEEAAKVQRVIEEDKPNPCHPAHPQCDHKYSYSISEFEVKS
tara:strand:- start:199 stop:399 length:201 start_codon:yes stop_codon:yes gene_type:complete